MARKSKRLNHNTQEPSVTMPVYNVAIYIRISNEENIRNVGTLEFQKQIALEYMKDKSDMVLYDIYIVMMGNRERTLTVKAFNK